MVNFDIYALLILLVGIINFYYAIKAIKNKNFLENYVKKSPKAFIWRKMFGKDEATKIIRKVFAPIGIIIGSVLILFGFYLILF